jgi:hypothetical protein
MDGVIDTLRTDPDLRPPIERHGRLSIVPTDDLLARFVVSVLRQQVSMASAAATRRRLFEAVEVPPDTLDADDDTLRDAGLSRQRTRCVTNVAAAFRDRGYTLDSLAGMDDRAVVDVQHRSDPLERRRQPQQLSGVARRREEQSIRDHVDIRLDRDRAVLDCHGRVLSTEPHRLVAEVLDRVQNRLRLLAVVERQHADADSTVRAIRHADPFRSAAERYAGRPRPPAVSDPPDSAGVNR